MNIIADRHVNDFKHKRVFSKKPRLQSADKKLRRIWKKFKGKRKYGWLLWVYSPVAYFLEDGTVIVSYQTYDKIQKSDSKLLEKINVPHTDRNRQH